MDRGPCILSWNYVRVENFLTKSHTTPKGVWGRCVVCCVFSVTYVKHRQCDSVFCCLPFTTTFFSLSLILLLYASQAHAAKLMCDMLSAVRYLHEQGIAHRDLKLENFLFEQPGMHSPLKLIDFGLSKHFDEKESMHQVVGSAYYTAPEVLGGNYDFRCDIWSLVSTFECICCIRLMRRLVLYIRLSFITLQLLIFQFQYHLQGVIAYMLLSGAPPFNGDSSEKIHHLILVST